MRESRGQSCFFFPGMPRAARALCARPLGTLMPLSDTLNGNPAQSQRSGTPSDGVEKGGRGLKATRRGADEACPRAAVSLSSRRKAPRGGQARGLHASPLHVIKVESDGTTLCAKKARHKGQARAVCVATLLAVSPSKERGKGSRERAAVGRSCVGTPQSHPGARQWDVTYLKEVEGGAEAGCVGASWRSTPEGGESGGRSLFSHSLRAREQRPDALLFSSPFFQRARAPLTAPNSTPLLPPARRGLLLHPPPPRARATRPLSPFSLSSPH